MEAETVNKQDIISDFWLRTAKNIHTTEDKYNLTTFVEGKLKHDAEVAYINAMDVLKPNSTVLDLACGNGRLCETFCNSVEWITGTDLCEDFIIYLNNWKIAQQKKNTDFYKLDLLAADYTLYLNRTYSVIFLFGTSQCIVDDNDLINILKNIHKLLTPNGKLLLKQTTSVLEQDIFVDQISTELNQHWIAKYRTSNTIKKLAEIAGLSVLSVGSIYNKTNLGERYEQVERWDNTRQMIFEIEKA